MSSADRAFHASFKPKWTTHGQLLYTSKAHNAPTKPWNWHDSQIANIQPLAISRLVGDGVDVSYCRFWRLIDD